MVWVRLIFLILFSFNAYSNELTQQELQYFNFLDLNNDQYISIDEINKSIDILLDSADAVVILTDHDSIDFNLILSKAKLIVDTRNVYHRSKEKKLFRLGVGTTDY